MSSSFTFLSLESDKSSDWERQRKFPPLVDNAYRLLGIAANATQTEINRASDSIRREIKLEIDRSEPADLVWLGKLKRTEAGLLGAVSKLSEPPQRQIERLFWFHSKQVIEPVRSSEELLKSVSEILQREDKIIALHDAALLSLAVTYSFDKNANHPELWTKTLSLWKQLNESDVFWEEFSRLDLKGDFERVSSPSEIKTLRESLLGMILEYCEETALALLGRVNTNGAQRFFDAVRLAELPQTYLDVFENRVFGKYEEEFDSVCYDVFRRTSEEYYFKRRVKPYLKALCLLASEQSLVTQRSLTTISQHILNLANERIEAEQKDEAKLILRTAWNFAPHGSFIESEIYNLACEIEIEKSLPEKTAENAYEIAMKELADTEAAFQNPIELPQTIYQPTYSANEANTDNNSFSSWLGLGFSILIFFIMITICKSGKRNSYDYRNYNLGNYNRTITLPTPQLSKINLVGTISVEELKKIKEQGRVIILDVRSSAEYRAGHIQGAISFPADSKSALPKNLISSLKKIVVYDAGTDDDSKRVAEKLIRVSVFNVSILTGGYETWIEESDKPASITNKKL